jgi:hypothetical protein
MEFNGIVKPRRRGGWIARGLVVEQRFGQLVETQIGPREFADQSASVTWLTDAARRLGIGRPQIATLTVSRR